MRFSEAIAATAPNVLPPAVSIAHPFPVLDQRNVPCCVSIAVATCMEAIDAQVGSATRLAPLFNYFVARPDPSTLVLIELREGLNAAARVGICALALHPAQLSDAGALQPPSAEAVEDAKRRCIAGPTAPLRPPRYRSVTANDPMEWRRALALRMPLVIGFWVTPAYRALTSDNPVHGPVTGATSEGHAVTVLGYDDGRRTFTVKDSRGGRFGLNGHWLLPYALLSDGMVHEAWAVEKLTYD